MNVVVLYQSMKGNTRRAALEIGRGFSDRGHQTGVWPITALDYKALARADLVVVGTWVDGLFFFGQRPGQLAKLNAMPDIHGKRAAVFLTYAKNPGKAADKMADWAFSRGARVVARHAFHRNRVADDLDAFLDEALSFVEPVRP